MYRLWYICTKWCFTFFRVNDDNAVLSQVTAFSVYTERKFEVEPVQVIYPDGKSFVYPDLSEYSMEVSLSYISNYIGVTLEANQVICLSSFHILLIFTWLFHQETNLPCDHNFSLYMMYWIGTVSVTLCIYELARQPCLVPFERDLPTSVIQFLSFTFLYSSFSCCQEKQQDNSGFHVASSGTLANIFPFVLLFCFGLILVSFSSNEVLLVVDISEILRQCLVLTTQVSNLLTKMQLRVKEAKQCHFIVSVPPTRSDILHACDVVEVFYYYIKTFLLI